MTDNQAEILRVSFLVVCLLAFFATLKGCQLQDNEYRLEKLRIERNCPEVKK